MSTPEQMRAVVAHYVEEIHRAYIAQALTFPAAVRGQMPLLAPGPLTVAAGGGLSWSLRFFDPVVLPELALIDESAGPAFGEVRHALGVGTVVYHFVAEPGAGLSGHQAAHVGTGLAGGHLAVGRGLQTH